MPLRGRGPREGGGGRGEGSFYLGCAFGGVSVPRIYSHARWQLPKAIHVSVVVSVFMRVTHVERY